MIDQTDLGSIEEYTMDRAKKSHRNSIRLGIAENCKDLLLDQKIEEGTFSSSVFSRNQHAVVPKINFSHVPQIAGLDRLAGFQKS